MKLTVATRRSQLALAQTRAFARSLETAHGDLSTDELQVVTSGDKNQTARLQDIGGKGLFIKELEEALYDKRADFAVHSIKDVPAELAPGLEIACIPKREDPRDVIVTKTGVPLRDLPEGAVVGTSSLRRAVAVLAVRPDLKIEPIRGNVDTRLRKVAEGPFDATLLALAGLNRLGIADRATEILEPEVCLPAIGQGALGIEIRSDDDATRSALEKMICPSTSACVSAERAVMAAVEGDCKTPVAAFAIRDGNELWLRALLAEPDGSRVRHGERRMAWTLDLSECGKLGRDLGEDLKGR